LYRSGSEWLTHVAPFVADGLAVGEAVLVVASARKAKALRLRLGRHADRVAWADAAEWLGGTPTEAVALWHDFMSNELDESALGTRVVSEAFWRPHPLPEAREWLRFEAVVNIVFGNVPVQILCPYHRRLPVEVRIGAERTHSRLAAPHGHARRRPFVAPEVFVAELDSSPLPDPTGPTATLTHPRSLGEVRRFVGDVARRAGQDPEAIGALMLAVHEVAANAVVHGGGLAEVRIWQDDSTLVAEVADRGGRLVDPCAGFRPPTALARAGRGLWLARRLCRLVEIRTGPGGTVVRLHARSGWTP